MVANKFRIKLINDLKDIIPEIALEDKKGFSLNQFKSRKNLVYDLEFNEKPENFPRNMILKIYLTENADNEHNTYKILGNQSIPIAKVLYYKKPYLLLEKLKGINLCDVINKNLINETKLNDLNPTTLEMILLSVRKLAEWIAQLHKQNLVNKKDISRIIVLNKGDTRLRDFIIDFNNEILYGLDFEESYQGNYLDDLAWICCAFLDTDPGIFEMFEPHHKIELINIFLKEYFRINNEFQFSFNYFAERLIENLNIVIERRSLDFGPVRKDSILKSILKEY